MLKLSHIERDISNIMKVESRERERLLCGDDQMPTHSTRCLSPPFSKGMNENKNKKTDAERESEREWLKELNIEREKFDVVKSLVKKYDYYYESINIFQHKIPSSTHTRMTGRQAARECDVGVGGRYTNADKNETRNNIEIFASKVYTT